MVRRLPPQPSIGARLTEWRLLVFCAVLVPFILGAAYSSRRYRERLLEQPIWMRGRVAAVWARSRAGAGWTQSCAAAGASWMGNRITAGRKSESRDQLEPVDPQEGRLVPHHRGASSIDPPSSEFDGVDESAGVDGVLLADRPAVPQEQGG